MALARSSFRAARWRIDPATLVLAGCALVAAWLVLVPLGSLFIVAFCADTPYGPGAFTFANFAEAYGSTALPKLFLNSLIYAVGASIGSFVFGTAIAWVVERTDAPLRGLFHTLAIASFAVPGLLVAMAWTLVASPNIG